MSACSVTESELQKRVAIAFLTATESQLRIPQEQAAGGRMRAAAQSYFALQALLVPILVAFIVWLENTCQVTATTNSEPMGVFKMFLTFVNSSSQSPADQNACMNQKSVAAMLLVISVANLVRAWKGRSQSPVIKEPSAELLKPNLISDAQKRAIDAFVQSLTEPMDDVDSNSDSDGEESCYFDINNLTDALQNMKTVGGRSSTDKVFVLGRERKVHKKLGDRKQYVIVQKKLVSLAEARSMERAQRAKTKA